MTSPSQARALLLLLVRPSNLNLAQPNTYNLRTFGFGGAKTEGINR